jgi:hypothetical protein
VVTENGTIYDRAFVLNATQTSFFAVSASGTLIWKQMISFPPG